MEDIWYILICFLCQKQVYWRKNRRNTSREGWPSQERHWLIHTYWIELYQDFNFNNTILVCCKMLSKCLLINSWIKRLIQMTGGSVVKNLPANAGDVGSIPGSGRSSWVGNSNWLQYSCLGNPMDRGTWGVAVHGVSESDTTEQAFGQQQQMIFINWLNLCFPRFPDSLEKKHFIVRWPMEMCCVTWNETGAL